jgi:hypothetical protein
VVHFLEAPVDLRVDRDELEHVLEIPVHELDLARERCQATIPGTDAVGVAAGECRRRSETAVVWR